LLNAIRFAREEKVPYFGICLGMQLLMDESEEGPGRGLGGEAVERDALGRGERFVGDEVVQRAPELRRDVLKRTDGRTYQARLDLADESLG